LPSFNRSALNQPDEERERQHQDAEVLLRVLTHDETEVANEHEFALHHQKYSHSKI